MRRSRNPRWLEGLVELCRLREASSVHVTFMTEAEWTLLGKRGFLQRNDQQFHWENGGFATFEDFLAALASRKRKTIRRERRDALSCGIEVEWLTGSDLTESAWDAFFAFYTETGSRKWGRPYLTREFFSRLGETMARRDRADHGAARRALHRRRDQLHRRRHAVRPPLGRASSTTRSCISRSATIRRSTMRSRTSSRASRPARRASTSSPAAICRPRPIRPTTSPIPALRRAIDDYLARERAYVAAAGRELLEASPFRKDLAEEEAAGF